MSVYLVEVKVSQLVSVSQPMVTSKDLENRMDCLEKPMVDSQELTQKTLQQSIEGFVSSMAALNSDSQISPTPVVSQDSLEVSSVVLDRV